MKRAPNENRDGAGPSRGGREVARRIAFWRSGGAPENVSKNLEFGEAAKKTRIFFQKRDLRWGMEYISFFSKIKLFFTKKGPS